ncbi:MAG: aminotransferase class V-fold PLP-dependent enzyme, partial [bacterium]
MPSRPTYFGGGTVDTVDALSAFHVARAQLAPRLERGTLNFAAITALPAGLRVVQRLGMAQIDA